MAEYMVASGFFGRLSCAQLHLHFILVVLSAFAILFLSCNRVHSDAEAQKHMKRRQKRKRQKLGKEKAEDTAEPGAGETTTALDDASQWQQEDATDSLTASDELIHLQVCSVHCAGFPCCTYTAVTTLIAFSRLMVSISRLLAMAISAKLEWWRFATQYLLCLQTLRCKHKIRSAAISPHGLKDGVLVTIALVNNSLEVTGCIAMLQPA